MKKLLSPAASVFLLVVLSAAPSAGAASVVKCKTKVYGGDSPVFVTSARGLTCTAAAREQKRYKWTGRNTFRTPGGYSCTPSGQGAVGYQIRCVKRTRAYRIEFAD